MRSDVQQTFVHGGTDLVMEDSIYWETNYRIGPTLLVLQIESGFDDTSAEVCFLNSHTVWGNRTGKLT